MDKLDLRECRACGKAFVSKGETDVVCPSCRIDMDALYDDVRDFLRDNPKRGFSAAEIAEQLGVEERKIQALLEEGRLAHADVPGRVRCESCGAPIPGGHLCDACSRRLHQHVLRSQKGEMYTRRRRS